MPQPEHTRLLPFPEASAAGTATRQRYRRIYFFVSNDAESSNDSRSQLPAARSERAGSSRYRSRFDYFLVESTRTSEPLPVAEPRLSRRTVLTFPLLPPPQKN
jgi:hypothetical protein